MKSSLHTVRTPRAAIRALAALGAIAAIAVVQQLLAGVVLAHHPDYLHITSAHTDAPETVCASAEDASVTFGPVWAEGTALNAVVEAVFDYDYQSGQSGGRSWNNVPDGRVSFQYYDYPCSQVSAVIEFHIRPEGGQYAPCGDGVQPQNCMYLAGSYSTHNNVTDRAKAVVYIQTNTLLNLGVFRRDASVSHEAGHAFGLSDPPQDQRPGYPTYTGRYCGESVMHGAYYGCGQDLEWPQQGTRQRQGA